MQVAFVAACAITSVGRSDAQTRYADAEGIYSFSPPPGWTQAPEKGVDDVQFAAPGGSAVGLLRVAIHSPLSSPDADAEAEAYGSTIAGRRALKVDGVDCITQEIRDSFSEKSALVCHLTIETARPHKVAFWLNAVAPPGGVSARRAVFDAALASLRWGPSVMR